MTQHIVVGIDGSPRSAPVLSWAVKQARATGADVEVVMAWELFETYGYVDLAAVRASAEKSLQEIVNTVSDPDVAVTARLVDGSPAAVLISAANDADLLVVGNRGRGGFTGLLLGSVSAQCVHHATCPVVVVKASPEE